MEHTQTLLSRRDVFDVSDPQRSVSSRSRLGDLVWHLDTEEPGRPQRGVRVSWDIGFGTAAPAAEHEVKLRDYFQRLAWLCLADPKLAHSKTSGLTVFAYECGHVARFMLQHGIDDVSDVTPSRLEAFCEWVAEELAGRDDPRTEDPRWVRRIVARRLRPFTWIWKARSRLKAAGLPSPAKDPLAGRSPGEVAGHVARLIERMVPAIPNEAFLRMMNAATSIIIDHAEEVLQAQDIWFRCTGGIGTAAERAAACKELATFRFSAPTGKYLRWPVRLTDDGRLDPNEVSKSLCTMIHAVRDAAEIIALGSIGLRGSEFRAIAGGWTGSADNPDALAVEQTDEVFEVYLLRSLVSKGQIVPAPADWIVGAALTGLERVPLGVSAIRVVERLMAPWRSLCHDPEARMSICVRLPRSDLPREERSIRRMLNASVTPDIRCFLRDWVDWSGMPDFSDGLATDDLRALRDLRGGTVQARQFRKSYGQFVMRVDSELLPALKEQYKHMRMSTTQSNYTSNDPRITGGSSDEQRLAGNRAVAAMLGMKGAVVGRLADLITRHERELKLPELDGYEPATPERLQQLGISLIPGEHGWCGIAFAPSLSRCNQLDGKAHPLNTRPSEQLRSPSVCAGCPVFAIDRSAEPYWRRRLRVNEEVWQAAVDRGEERFLAIARDRVVQARSVLKWLDKKGGSA